ncbi:hypothetical protein RA266_27845, partial [Pseudomonas syringae pv. tagetis]|uniref:hypothetical protein n=1 Tax=Pseudomonas syringae group genomosp. 7 TaxID=251699 RepID=UPI003770694E
MLVVLVVVRVGVGLWGVVVFGVLGWFGVVVVEVCGWFWVLWLGFGGGVVGGAVVVVGVVLGGLWYRCV